MTKPVFRLLILLITDLFVYNSAIFAQSTGLINRQATSAPGRLVLDPNSDGYTSVTTSGFGTDDVTNSEIPYKLVKSAPIEPYGDLRRGPDHRFSDFVPDGNNDGFYTFFSGTNFLFRLRLGSVMSGSKGYSILLDTDGKFGATGPNADPNYQPATTGTNGNPGFEIEIVLETNFRIAIYNVDGTSSPTLVKQYTNWQDMSQVSIAASFDNGDPDFFMDFYIPFSDLQAAPFNLTTSSPLRMVATTVMSPQGAIGGPKSDIYGIDDSNYPNPNDQYEVFINTQPPFTMNDLSGGGGGIANRCTAPPAVSGPISTGTVNISGSWTKSSLAGAAEPASITVFKNGTAVGTVSGVNSGSVWTVNNITTVSNDIITAKAQATGESMCLVSNTVIANNCNNTNRPAKPALVCTSGSKGLAATNLSTGWTVHVDNETRNILNDNITNTGGLFGTPTGTSPNLNWDYSGGCSSGAPLTSGSYKVYYVNNSTGCVSEPAYFCAAGNGGNALAGSLAVPVITVPSNNVFTTATTSVTGTTDANASVTLYVDGGIKATTTANGSGVFTFSNQTFLQGQQLYFVVTLNTGAVSTSKCANQTAVFAVTCYTPAPLVNADANNQVTAGAPITGTASGPAGTTIRVYTSGAVLVATAAVLADGTWSTGNAGTLPATYNALAGTSYYATAQIGTCSISLSSATVSAASQTSAARCGTITGPVAPNAASVSGTVTGSFTTTTVNLYLDDVLIGTTTTNTAAWGPIIVNSTINNALYSNGVLTIGIRETGKQEVNCPASATAITCAATPAAPVFTPTSSTITANQTVTYTISNAVSGTFYGIANSSTGESLANGVWAVANGTLNITTKSFPAAGTYNIVIKATSLTGLDVCSSLPAAASLIVSGSLPVHLINFNGDWRNDNAVLNWSTANENNSLVFQLEKSKNGNAYTAVARIAAAGNSQVQQDYSYTDSGPFSENNYYRLKMVDRDGYFKYSQVINLQKKEKGITFYTVWPNPFSSLITVNVSSGSPASLLIRLTDLAGRQIKTRVQLVNRGNSQVVLQNLEQLVSGIYILEITNQNSGNHLVYKIFKE